MPLSKEKQKQWMREYRLRKKSVIPSVIPNMPIQAHVIPKIPGLVMQGNRIVGVEKKIRYNDENVIPKLPICNEHNFRQFSPGEHVLVRRGRRLVETVMPELDADGNPM